MIRSEIDRRAKRYLAYQCPSDTGHKDAPEPIEPKKRTWRFVPLKDRLSRLNRGLSWRD